MCVSESLSGTRRLPAEWQTGRQRPACSERPASHIAHDPEGRTDQQALVNAIQTRTAWARSIVCEQPEYQVLGRGNMKKGNTMKWFAPLVRFQ